jgi:hypothetical protein
MLTSSQMADLRALAERSLLLELARTEDALRGGPSPSTRPERRPVRERSALLAYQQRLITELRRRRHAPAMT